MGVFLQLSALGVFLATYFFWERLPCLVKKLPGMEKRLRYCHYKEEQLSFLASRMKHEESELSFKIRRQEEEFQEKAWQLSEEARRERKEVALAEPPELTLLRLKRVELEENLKAILSSLEWVQLLQSSQTPARWGALFLFVLGEFFILGGIFILRQGKKRKTPGEMPLF